MPIHLLMHALTMGALALDLGGVYLVINKLRENCYIDVAIEHEPKHVELALAIAGKAGLELMDETECAPTMLEDGTVRSYLVEVQAVGSGDRLTG